MLLVMLVSSPVSETRLARPALIGGVPVCLGRPEVFGPEEVLKKNERILKFVSKVIVLIYSLTSSITPRIEQVPGVSQVPVSRVHCLYQSAETE